MFKWLRRQPSRKVSDRSVLGVDPDERVYAVGDIHGRADLLEIMIASIARDIAAHSDHRSAKLIFLGDYVDRGDHSREVVGRLRQLQENPPADAQVICLRGNHEAALLDFLDSPTAGTDWLEFGGLQTLGSYGVPRPRSVSDTKALFDSSAALADGMGEDVAFLRSCPAMARSGDIVFSHAGLDPDCGLSNQSDHALLWGRRSFLDRGIAGIQCVHGHYDGLDPVIEPWRICVDTGAYYSGRLCAVRLDQNLEFLVATVRNGD